MDKDSKGQETTISDKERVIANLQNQISHLVNIKGESQNTLPGSISNLSPMKVAEGNQQQVTISNSGAGFDPYAPPPPGTQAAISKGGAGFDPYAPPPPGTIDHPVNIEKLGKDEGYLEIALKPGYYGFVLLPCFNER